MIALIVYIALNNLAKANILYNTNYKTWDSIHHKIDIKTSGVTYRQYITKLIYCQASKDFNNINIEFNSNIMEAKSIELGFRFSLLVSF